jgi:hypothetical protein
MRCKIARAERGRYPSRVQRGCSHVRAPEPPSSPASGRVRPDQRVASPSGNRVASGHRVGRGGMPGVWCTRERRATVRPGPRVRPHPPRPLHALPRVRLRVPGADAGPRDARVVVPTVLPQHGRRRPPARDPARLASPPVRSTPRRRRRAARLRLRRRLLSRARRAEAVTAAAPTARRRSSAGASRTSCGSCPPAG